MQRIALVTGAGSGIGRACSLALLRDGWTVVLNGRRQDRLEATATRAGDAVDACRIRPADVTDPAAVETLFEGIRREYGRLDLLFNNAGIFIPSAPIDEIELEDWNRAVAVNLTGAFLCTRAAFRLMKTQEPRGGRIINNGSISAHVPRPHAAAYTATKTALTGLTRATALDGRPYQIACGQIDIGNAGTDMTSKMKDGVRQANGTLVPEPTMDVEHVAQAVVYMAGLSLDANVPSLTVLATQMPYAGRG